MNEVFSLKSKTKNAKQINWGVAIPLRALALVAVLGANATEKSGEHQLELIWSLDLSKNRDYAIHRATEVPPLPSAHVTFLDANSIALSFSTYRHTDNRTEDIAVLEALFIGAEKGTVEDKAVW